MIKNTIGYSYNAETGHNEITFEHGKNLLFIDQFKPSTQDIKDAKNRILKSMEEASSIEVKQEGMKPVHPNNEFLVDYVIYHGTEVVDPIKYGKDKNFGDERMKYVTLNCHGEVLNHGTVYKEPWETSIFYQILKKNNLEKYYNYFVVCSIEYEDDNEFIAFKTHLVKNGITLELDGTTMYLVEFCVGGNQGKQAKSLLVPKEVVSLLRREMLGSIKRSENGIKAGLTWMKENAAIAYGLNNGVLIKA